jgi:signal transduction histidine kinase
VDAAEDERRRIERDLHDGAQQRLVALAMDLGMAREKLRTDPQAATELVGEAHEEAKRALAELRDLARGIHPAVLADRGLDAAISALAARSPVPVGVDVATGRLPGPVESTAYFVVAEALTNAAKHARAGELAVRIARQGDLLVVEVTDDGAGGADPARGNGLRGLADRVAAIDGRLTVTSPPGGPTLVRAELPCGR